MGTAVKRLGGFDSHTLRNLNTTRQSQTDNMED